MERQISGTVYFASDFHLGTPNSAESRKREKAIVRWLDRIAADATHLFLLGDIFDFWFEYRDVVPKGYFSLFSKLLELKELGVKIYYFTGNHDMWMRDYLVEELGVELFRQQQVFTINGKRCVIGHGDGLDPHDRGYLLIKRLFAFPPHVWLYSALPPRWAFAIARTCSHRSRQRTSQPQFHRHDEDKMVAYIQQYLQQQPADIFIYGHRHLPLQLSVKNATYFNTGDWLSHYSFVRATPNTFELLYEPKPKSSNE